MTNTITLDAQNFGPLASPYSYRPELRKRLDEIHAAALRSENRYFVLRGADVIAAGATESHALAYLSDGCVIVEVRLFPPELIERARQAWQWLPFRSCWVAVKGTEEAIVLKATAHVANKLAREGWMVARLHKA